jgi:hypothetical protein
VYAAGALWKFFRERLPDGTAYAGEHRGGIGTNGAHRELVCLVYRRVSSSLHGECDSMNAVCERFRMRTFSSSAYRPLTSPDLLDVRVASA